MRYSYKSNGIVSRSIGDYRDNLLSDFSTFQIWEGDKEFTEEQYQTITIEETSVASNNYGNISQYGSHGIGSRVKATGIGSDTQVATGGILIVGERGPAYISGSATTFAKYMPITSITCFGSGANRYCVYSYEAGNVSETVGQHGSSVINAGIGARRIDSFQFVFDTWTPISRFVGAAEASVKVYEPCITEEYTELDYGLITANHTATIDNGLVSHTDAVTIEDRGNILDGWKTRFGFKRVIGEAQAKATNAWIGSGGLISWGRQVSPSVWGYIVDGKVRLSGTADVDFSASTGGGGFSRLQGFSITGFTVSHYGDGSLKKFAGAAESATWNPDERQMLFSFTGGLASEKHVESYVGSGRIKNLAKIEAEKQSFDYVGSGDLLRLVPRKPVVYQLSELANFTLETDMVLGQKYWQDPGDNYSGNRWHQTTKLGGIKLKDIKEKDHEKFAKVFDQSAFVEFVRKDYGNLVNTNLTNCVATSGTISSSATATSGCIKVAPGTTLAIAPGNTYTVPNQLTTPSSTEDYGLVSESNITGYDDYGWILDTSNLRDPYGLGLRFTSQIEVNVTKQFHFTSDGTPPIFKITGRTALPLDVSEEGSGTLFALSGASEAVANVLDGTGLYRFLSFTHTTRLRHLVGSGSLKKFSGAAESTTWNPLERQLLFSFVGERIAESKSVTEIGSGRLSTFSGSSESILWSAQHATGLYRISGDSIDLRARAFEGSGSLKKFSGVAESTTWNPLERQLLFSFTGNAEEKNTEVYVGSGRIRNLATLEAEKQSFDYVGSGSISLLPRKPECYELEELANFTLDQYVLRSNYINLGDIDFYNGPTNLGDAQLRWIVCEEGHEKHTEAYNNSACWEGVELDYGEIVNQSNLNCVANSGTINTNTVATSGCIKVAPGTTLAIATGSTYTIPNQLSTPTEFEDYGDVANFNAPEWRDYGWILGTLSKKCPYGLFNIEGTATSFYTENIVSTGYSVSGKAGITLFGAADTFWTPPYHAYGLFRVEGDLHESFTPATHVGSGSIRKLGGAAETIANVEKADGLFRVGGAVYSLFSLLHPGSGTIRVLGTGGESITPATHVGSGSLKKFSGAAESATWNPLERQLLFSFTGEGTETFTANPPEEGTEIRLSGTTYPELLTFAEQPFGRIPVSGVGGTERTRVFVGSGSLKKFSGAAESLTFNPLERQLLFSFTGSGSEAFVANPPEEGTNIRLRGEAVVIWEASHVGSGRIHVFGDGLSKTTKPFIGSGSLKKFSGAAESLTYNPLERQLLFSFTGAGSENTTTIEIGSGRLFTLAGSVSSTAAAYESTGLFKFGGFTETSRSGSHIGSGSLKKFSGGAESVTYNPDEKQLLFSFIGSAEDSRTSTDIGSGRIAIYPEASDYRFTPNWNSVGGIRLEIEAAYRFAPVWIGSGSLKKFSGAAESITVNPLEKQLLFSFMGSGEERVTLNPPEEGTEVRLSGDSFIRWVPNNIGSGTIRVSGIGKTHWVPHVIGSGSLYNFSGAAESTTTDITTIPSLFRVYGDGHVSRTRPYTGFGSLKKLSGSAESVTYNPDEKQMLFSFIGVGTTTRTRSEVGQGRIKISGDAGIRFTPAIIGSGTTRLSGEATVTRSRDFVGFGSLKKFSGAAESLTYNPTERDMLFSFVGEGTQARTSKLLSQGGVLAVRGTSGDPILTFAEQPEVQIAVSGDSIDLRTHAYQGSGRISNVNSLDESFTRDGYEGSGRISLSGVALVQVIVWQPPNTQVWII